MGDFIEFTSWPEHGNIFYKITSGAVAFSLKGEEYVEVGLAKRPGETFNYSIRMAQNECWMDKDQELIGKHKEVPNILSRDAFTKFWISWYSDRLQFGYTSDGVPLISKKIPVQEMEFISFSRKSQKWKLYLPPKIEKPLLRKVRGGEMHWVKAEDQLPDGALIGGYEKEILYIIRALHRGSLTPGKFVPSEGLGFVSWGGDMHEKNKFEVLCGYNSIWVPTYGNRIPVGSVEGGYAENTHETLYVGRAVEDGHLIPGKVQPSHGVCYIPYNEKEIAKREFEILVNPQIAMHSPNRYLVPHTHQNRPDNEVEDAYAGMGVIWKDEDYSPSSESD